MIICKNTKKINNSIYDWLIAFHQMAEASIAAFGAGVGVLIAMAVVVFALRGKGHTRAPDA
tara:strand:- start:1710 stop:1892 length:183 start_codon:yes stop_codon:yes gene_type:complete